uniref:Legume lectin domain-containing protein n=1 Tax=Araucaria cunninghamii TaxID=56994 RepID=A0A0D6R0F1_ARACU
MGGLSSRYVYAFLLLLFTQGQGRPVKHFGPCHTYFSFPSFNHQTSPLTLLGDAEFLTVEGYHSPVLISGSSPRSAGRLMYGKPVRMLQPLAHRSSVSFSSYFSFSMSPGNGDGLAFVILPRGYPSGGLDGQWFGLSSDKGSVSHIPNLFAVEFDSAMNKEVMDLNGNHVGIDIESLISTKSADVSEIEVVLNDGTQLHAWIDYDARSKNLEVRLSKSGLIRPSDPLVSHSVDLSGLWKDEMYVGISSSTGDSSQTSLVYSWNFSSSPLHWPEHSHPVNPQAFKMHHGPSSLRQRADDILGILMALLFGAGCGAMAALVMFMLWSLFSSRFGFTSTEFVAHPVDFGYQKIGMTVGKDAPDANIK